MSNVSDPHLVTIRNVRLSFPVLFEPRAFKNPDGTFAGTPKRSATFLLDKAKNKADIDALTKAALHTKKEKWQDKPVNLTGKSIRDGSEKEATDGYGPGIVFISASQTPKPGDNWSRCVVDEKLNPVTAEDAKFYAGCYVNATVKAWAQDNSYGKRINWQLVNIQYLRKGEPFGEKPVPVSATLKEEAVEEDGSQVDGVANDQV
jgi:hypothetical protein